MDSTTLHITSGDSGGSILSKSSISGEVFVWHDILYDGPREPGWPSEQTLASRATFLETTTGGGLRKKYIYDTLKHQYEKLGQVTMYDNLVLWFDGCLFDQSMLCHILMCLQKLEIMEVDLLCVDHFPAIDPYHGLGQLSPEQMASVYGNRTPVTKKQFEFAEEVDRAFAQQDRAEFTKLKNFIDAPLPWIPAAVSRWLEEYPDPATGRGRLEQCALDAINSGCTTPEEIFSFASDREAPPQYWGDISLWEKVNRLADHEPPLIRIEGPSPRLPQWEGITDYKLFRIYPAERSG